MIKKQKINKDTTNKMPYLKSLILEAKQVRIYLNPGEEPPKGKKVQKGPRGGLYYMDSPELKSIRDNDPAKKLRKKVNAKNLKKKVNNKKTKSFDESDLDETIFKMDKWMPEETDVQDEYYDILENGDVGELEDFLEMHADEEILHRYLPKGAKFEDLATYIWNKYSSWGKKHKFSDEQPTRPENI